MENIIIDNQEIRYNVVDGKGKILRESVIHSVAIRFIEGLKKDAQKEVKLIPIVESGDQILFG